MDEQQIALHRILGLSLFDPGFGAMVGNRNQVSQADDDDDDDAADLPPGKEARIRKGVQNNAKRLRAALGTPQSMLR